MSFPTSPTNGQISVVNNVAYQYATANSSWTRVLSIANVIQANVISANVLNVVQTFSVAGNIATGNYFIGNGAFLTGIAAGSSYSNSNVAAYLPTYTGNLVSLTGPVTTTANVTANNVLFGTGVVSGTGTVYAATVSTTGNVNSGYISTGQASVGNLISGGYVSATGNITGGNILGGANVNATTHTGTTVSVSANVTGGNVLTGGLISATGNITGGNITIPGSANISTFIGNAFFGSVPAQPTYYNIAPLNLNNSLAAATKVQLNLINTGGGAGAGSAIDFYTYLLSVAAANAEARIAAIDDGNYAAYLSLQTKTPGSTGTNNLVERVKIDSTGASVVANVTGGNLLTAGVMSSTGNAIHGNILTAGLISATGNVTGNYILGNGALLTGVITSVANINSGTSNVTVVSSGGNVTVGIGGTSNVAVFSTEAVTVKGNVLPSANITYDLGTSTQRWKDLWLSNSTIYLGNAQISANATAITITNPAGGNTILQGATPSITGNTVSVSGNITGGNVVTGGLISASGNITGASISTSGVVSATGNVTGGNINTNTIVGTALTFKSTGALNLSTTGNVVFASNVQINNVGYPQQDADAATKLYVDNLATTGFAFHTQVTAATTTTLATTTGGSITYAQPNGAANGVGATLTTTGTFNLIDTANVQTVGTRILVKNEANTVFNGVYTWANATNIVRSLDTDEYGADSTAALSINDYFFVASGNVNYGSSYVVSAPTGTITFGTSGITFSQFSTSQIYSAGTGLTLTGTTFSVNASQTQITTVGTLGALTVTANTTSGNLLTGGLISATGNITGGNLSGTNIVGTLTTSSQTNITSVGTLGALTVTANTTSGNLLTGGLVSATGNVTGNYILGNGALLTGIAASYGNANVVANLAALGSNPVSTTGNITGGNILTVGLISATGTVTGSQLVVTGTTGIAFQGNSQNGTYNQTILYDNQNNTSASAINGLFLERGRITDSAVAEVRYFVIGARGGQQQWAVNGTGDTTQTGQLTATNLYSNAVVSATGNVIGSNILTGGLISATGNITGGNFVGTLNGSGANVTSISATNISSGTLTQARLANAAVTLGSTALTLGSTVTTVAGLTSVTSTTFVGALTGAATSATTAATVTTAAQPNITSVGTLTGLTINNATTAITNGAANGVGNIGTSANSFNVIFAKATSAQYADLAEMYVADADYAPGTVLEFGGNHEVTVSNTTASPLIAGVVSTNPAHLMNSTAQGKHLAAIALVGRVPTLVVGPVNKGAMMVSAGNGHAQACATPAMGTVIGKAVEDFAGESGTIEIAVGRL